MKSFLQMLIRVIRKWIRFGLDALQQREPMIFGLAALAVGLASGVGIWLFKSLLEFTKSLAFDKFGGLLGAGGGWTVALIPLLGGLLVAVIHHYFIGVERHHGVAGIMEAVALAGGRLRYKRIPAKALASALSIGTGASVGPEDPSVQIGANMGSMFGQWLNLSEERVRVLVAAGAAGGVASAFNAPIAGVFFALELIMGDLSGSSLGIVLISAVISSVFTQAVSGPQPAFAVPAYAFKSAWELPLYLLLGLIAGPLSALYARLVYVMQDLFARWPFHPLLKTAAAGLGVGLVGIFLPQVFGVGYDTIEQILAGKDMVILLLLALVVAKLILTPFSLAGGFLGGVFAPSLFIGANLGAAFGLVINTLFPSLHVTPVAFAMVGMAAMLAGAVHAPLTAILLLFEMTNDYHIILPLMFAVAVSLLISRHLEHESVYTLGLVRKGIRLDRGRDVEILEGLTVGEIMRTNPDTLLESTPLSEASELFAQTRHHGMAVLDESGLLVGVLTVQDIDRALADGRAGARVGDYCTRQPLLVTYPDETMGEALRCMGGKDVGRLPVVAHENSRLLVGILSRSDLVRAYDVALSRQAMLRQSHQQARLDASRGDKAHIMEIVIEKGAPCEGLLVREVSWPRESVLASLRRGRRMLIPRGETRLHAGDVLVIVLESHVQDDMLRLCHKGKPPA